METVRRARDSERAIALPLVLAVLVCLLAVAVPFALSMRHEQGGATYRGFDADARRAAESVRDLALTKFGDRSTTDTNRWSDPPDRLKVDVEGAARSIGIGDLGARARLLSGSLEDQSARIDLNRASLFLMARLLGLQTQLAGKLKADDKEIRLVDGDFLQDEGFLWIDGEVTFYRRREGASVFDLTRPAAVPGVWEPARMAGDAREFEAGTAVVDMRAWMAAAWIWKSPQRENQKSEARFDSLAHPFAIAGFGRGALGPAQRERLERFATIHVPDADRVRFGNPQRVFSELVAGETQEVRLEQGHFAGPGSICRITTYEGKVDYGVVHKVDVLDNGLKFTFDMPLLVAADAGQAVAEFLLPRAVNINSCTKEMLELLMTGLKLRGTQVEVEEKTAEMVASRILGARPFNSMRELIALLEVMVSKEKVLKGEQRAAILLNAEHPGNFQLEWGTAPFCFASEGVVEVRAAASMNFSMTGREKSRAMLREIVDVGGSGKSLRVFATQRDFEEPWRITRMARGWTTFPENLDFFEAVERFRSVLPPNRIYAMFPPRDRFAAEDMNGTGARLAASKLFADGVQYDKTYHFDGRRGDYDSMDPDGWRMADGAVMVAPNGSDDSVLLVTNFSGVERPRPFGVSLWWNPGKSLGAEQTLFDWRCNVRSANPDTSDRVRLKFKENKLVFEVDDAFRRDSTDDRYTSRIVYDFTDGLALEGDTWYHVTAFCRGNRGGQMCLWVDGKPRGKWSHYTRTTSTFDGATTNLGTIAIDGKRLADGTTKFPSQGAVRVGNQVFEYTKISGGALTIERDLIDHFGGVRPSPPPDQSAMGGTAPKPPGSGTSPSQKSDTEHPAQSGVELYGYSARLASDVPSGSATLDSDGLGRFGVAMLDPKQGKTAITITPTRGGSLTLGLGIENTANELDVLQLDGNDLKSSDKVFQRDGGFALLMSYDVVGAHWQDTKDSSNKADLKDLTPQGSLIQGVEVIYYAGCNGSKLTGVVRGHGLVSTLGKTDFVEQNKKQVFPYGSECAFVEKHAWILNPDLSVWRNYKAKTFTVLVVPIGVRVTGGQMNDHFLVPEVDPQRTDRPELLQIDSNFDGSFKNETEWVRYNAIVRDQSQGSNFLRSDPDQINWARFWLEGGGTVPGDVGSFNGNVGNQFTDQYYAIASAGANASGWAPKGKEYQTLIEGVNFERLDPNTIVSENRLAFRGVLGTVNSEHAGNARMYPVFRTHRRSGGMYNDALPGRYDEVTLVTPTPTSAPERFIINYAWTGDFCEGFVNNSFAHVAFLAQEVSTRVAATLDLGINTQTATGFAANVTVLADSRNFSRLLKHPSGELPNLWDGSGQLAIAADASGGSPTAATRGGGGGGAGGDGGKVDEVRVFACGDPESIYPQATYLLQLAVDAGEENQLSLYGDAIRVAHGVIGGLANNVGIHGDACVLQIGDDFIVGRERTGGLPMIQQVAENGRRRFGGEPGFHSIGESVQVLPWLVQSRLAAPLAAGESMISLADGRGFPRRGYVMIDEEVIGYTDLAPRDAGVQLYCPTTMDPLKESSSRTRGEAVFRGRFGTGAQSHATDAVVFWWPNRYDDGYSARCDIPEMATLELPIAARRGFFHSITWRALDGEKGADLIVTARVQGRGRFAADPDGDLDLFFFDRPGTAESPNLIDRQGDLLLLRFNVRYRSGALNATDFTGNGWKRAPMLQMVGVDYVADRVVELHEEMR